MKAVTQSPILSEKQQAARSIKRLQRKSIFTDIHRSGLASALTIGIPWGILHLSLIFPGQMNAGTSWLAPVLYLIALSIILTWFFIRTEQGIVVGLVYHAAQNFFIFFNGGLTAAESLVLMTAVTVAIAFALILMYGLSL